MDSKDRQIIAELQRNGRLSIQDLSARIGLSPTPTQRRVRLLEKSGVIEGYSAVVDQDLWGMPLTVFIRIKLERHSDDVVTAFETAIKALPQIMDCWLMTGEWDYQLRVLARDLPDYEHFIRQRLQRSPGVAAIDTSFAYSRVKQARTLPAM